MRSFAPSDGKFTRDPPSPQVRRMAGVVQRVVSGAEPPEYIDRCFEPEPCATPLPPAEAMWLDRAELMPAARDWCAAHLRAVPAAEGSAAGVAVALCRARTVRRQIAESIARPELAALFEAQGPEDTGREGAAAASDVGVASLRSLGGSAASTHLLGGMGRRGGGSSEGCSSAASGGSQDVEL